MNNDHPPTQISKICGHFGRATPTNHHSRSQRGVVIIHPDDISMIVPCFDVYFWLYIPIVYMIFPGIPLSIYIYISPEDFSGHHLADRRTGVGLRPKQLAFISFRSHGDDTSPWPQWDFAGGDAYGRQRAP